MDQDVQQLVQQLHKQAGRIVLVTAGAGTYALAWLLGVAGASNTLVEAVVPYDRSAFDDFLGQTPPDGYVEATVARWLAGRAYTRARWLLPAISDPIVGLACTATIATTRPKRGNHRAHLAIWTPQQVTSYHLILHKGKRNREQEETLVSRLLINLVAEGLGHTAQLPLSLTQGDTLKKTTTNIHTSIQEVMQAQQPFFHLPADGFVDQPLPSSAVILSGSFNPLHEGHLRLAQAASDMMTAPAMFEITLVNADKPALVLEEALKRVAQFAGRWSVLVSQAPTFAEKAKLYPHAVFVVGMDTATRVLDLRFYENSETKLAEAMDTMRQQGCRFLVAGRVDEKGKFQKASKLDVPASYEDLFIPIPHKHFRYDISSTELRHRGQRGSR